MTAQPSFKSQKKAQIQITETIIVLLIFFIILFFALFLYYQYSIRGIQETGEETLTTSSSVLLSSITSMPELKCSNENCVDAAKILAFKNLIEENRDYYSVLFVKKSIKIEQIYPVPISKEECSSVKYQSLDWPSNCKYFTLFESAQQKENKKIISAPVSLYFPTLNEYRIGKLTIEIYP